MIEVPRPPESLMRDREAAYAEVERRLGPWLRPGGLRVSPLGPGWSSDVDAYVTQLPDPSVLTAAGWLPLDHLLARIGLREHGRWAVVVEGRVVGAADIYDRPPPDRLDHLLDKCRRKGAGPRELAELEVLRAEGHRVGEVPERRPSARPRAVVGGARRALRPRLVVAISGVDGAGKTTLTERLVDDLTKAGVPATRIWARPGMTVSPVVDLLARLVKRVLGESPGGARAAAGEATSVRSRQGLLGRVWSALIMLNYGYAVLKQYAAARGVVVFDRHEADAEVTLQVLYPGQRHLSWPLVRRALPAPYARFHLEVPAEVAVERKPDDPIGEWAVQRQLEEYREVLDDGVTYLDGQEDPDRIVMRVLHRLTRADRR